MQRLLIAIVFELLGLALASSAEAACTVPNILTNGQPADATQVMANMNALATCVDSAPAGSANAVQYNAGAGAFGGVGPLTDGQVVIGSTGGAPVAATITAGSGISVANAAGGIVISATGTPVAPILVQAGYTRTITGTTGSVTLPAAPTAGHLLVALAAGYGSSTYLAVPAAFNTTASDRNFTSPNEGIVIGVRVAQTGDGVTWSGFSGGAGGDVYAVLEFSDAHAVTTSIINGAPTGVTWPFFASASSGAFSFFVLESDQTNSYSSITGASLMFDGTNPANNHPSVIATKTPGSPGNGVVTYTGSTFGASLLGTVSVIP